jgi:DNA (cytosine-5)-methyltransferase 1
MDTTLPPPRPTDRPAAADLFCCEGGVSTGLIAAGFDVTGFDIKPQPRYPYRFVQADALDVDLSPFEFVWASPPCQAYTRARPHTTRELAPRMVEAVREKLEKWGGPYVIENVPGAPIRPDLKLHGAMFGLPMHRDRWFESNVMLLAPSTRRHVRDGSLRNGHRTGHMVSMVGHFAGAPRARKLLGMPWASRYGLAQCIPPQFAEFIGRQVRA